MSRKVYKGYFVDRPFTDYGDCDLIGAHIAVNRENANIARSKRLEYYVYDDTGSAVVAQDVTKREKFFASVKYLFKLSKSKVVGYRSQSPNYASFRLGITYDENGKEIVDEGYYDNAIDRVMESNIPYGAKMERVASINAVREKARREVTGSGNVDELGEMLDEASSSKTQDSTKGNSKK